MKTNSSKKCGFGGNLMKACMFAFILLMSIGQASAQTTTARVTYYNLKGKTASGQYTQDGICAVSRDLEKMGFRMGDMIYVEGYGFFTIADRTSKKLKKTVDIWRKDGKGFKNGKNIKITRVVVQEI